MNTPLSFAQTIYNNELPYEQIPLSKKTWKEVDISYETIINGIPYLNFINLLRPEIYLVQHHMNQVGQKLTLTLPGIGLNHNVVTITAIRPAPQFKGCHQQSCSQVIGLFKHYATNVKIYRFKDLTTNKITIIHSTSNHLFYVRNKHQFLPIKHVSSKDRLLGESNHPIKLICKTNQLDHCGIPYNNQKPVIVYNLEVYKQHHYTVGQEAIVVHNDCSKQTNNNMRNIHQEEIDHLHNEINRYTASRNRLSKDMKGLSRSSKKRSRSFKLCSS